MSSVIGDAIKARIAEIEPELKAAEEAKEKIVSLKAEKRALEESLDKIMKAAGEKPKAARSRSASNGAASGESVTYEQITDAVRAAGKRVNSKEVAQALGTGTQNVARKLKKLADDKVLSGDKVSGYEIAA
jgi:response regulator of citrate/malate metabolism